MTNTTRKAPGAQRARRSAAALAGAIALVAVPLAGCGGDGGDDSPQKRVAAPKPAAGRAVTVDISSFKFKPDTITVKTGGTVTFVNRDKAPHTAQTELNPKTAEFDTGRLERGDEKPVRLTHAGSFEYFCAFHRFMEGRVEVVQ